MIDLRQASERLGYQWFTGRGNMNLCLVRSDNSKPGRFDDLLVIAGEDEYGNYLSKVWIVTVDPGDHYLQNFFPGQRSCAVLAPGFYRGAYRLGMHHDHEALIQVGQVEIFRDGNQNHIVDPSPSSRSRGFFGINIHSPWVYNWRSRGDLVGDKSAGCTVNETPNGHREVISFVKRFRRQNPTLSVKVFSERSDGV